MLTVLYLAFFVSGFSALVYQVVWQRLLLVFSGADLQSATIVVAAFMAGLSCGSYAGGKIADRLTARASLVLFAVAELAIGAFGLFSTNLYYDLMYQRLGHLASNLAVMATMLFASLLWPTFFMGLSLPALARTAVPEVGVAAKITGGLYGCNTLGAALGAFATTWWLLPGWGIEGSLRISAVLNMLVVTVAVPLAFAVRRRRGAVGLSQGSVEAIAQSPRPQASEAGVYTFPTWAAIYGLSGLLALSLEIVWFRLLGIMLKSTAFTFGTLLFVYLAGLGLGATVGSLLVQRIRQPARAFLLMQTTIGIYAGGSLTVLLAGLDDDSRLLRSVTAYFGGYAPLDARAGILALGEWMTGPGQFPSQFLLVHVLLPILLIGPPTVLMGAGFPLLQKMVQTDLARIGTRVGTLLTANIAGSTLGSVLTGWVFLGWFGTAGTLKLLVALSAAFSLFGLTRWIGRAQRAWHRWSYIAAITVAAGVFFSMPDARTLWARLHGTRTRFIVFGEDGSGTSVLKIAPGRREARVTVFANGIGQSSLPYGGIHTVLGALPAFIHPSPREAAVIGLGSGDTLFGMAGRKELQRIVCIEIIRPQIETLTVLSRQFRYPGLLTALLDLRIQHADGDGRIHLMHAQRRFDLIEADALRPTSAYAGNLYSDAYFALLRDRLTPGGIAVSWSPTDRTHRTFVKIFPHVLSYGSIVLGSNEPITFDPEIIRARVMNPAVLAHYAQAGVDILALLEPYLGAAPIVFGPSHDRSMLQDINTDLFPKDEFAVLWRAPVQ